MRSKQNKLKRKVSRRQKAGKPLKDLEKSVKDALSKLSVIETVYLNDVATTLRSVLREINGNGLSSMGLDQPFPPFAEDTKDWADRFGRS